MTIAENIRNDWLDGLHTQETAFSAAIHHVTTGMLDTIVEHDDNAKSVLFLDDSILEFPISVETETVTCEGIGCNTEVRPDQEGLCDTCLLAPYTLHRTA